MTARIMICVAIACAATVPAHAGVTIHYEGHARDGAAVDRAIATATEEAHRLGWRVESGNVDHATITRAIGGSEQPYSGPLRGITIYPHPMSEPLNLQFGSELFLQDYVKTQFAGANIHVAIVNLLRKLKPFFRGLEVEDEGEYWETNDRAKLERDIAAVNKAIEARKKQHPGAQGPVRLKGGRLVDVIQ